MIDRIVCAADIHIREKPYKNDLALGLRLLDDLATLAKKEKASHIVIPGDLFHSKTPSFTVLTSVYDKLDEIRKSGIVVYWIRGNHDLAIKSDPHNTIMKLFSRVCKTIIKPYIIENEYQLLVFMPWYPGPEFRGIMKKINAKAAACSKQRVLFAHIGVKEGEVSDNFRVNQEVGTNDFAEDLWDIIILGDYHRHQWVTDKVVYLGCPIPLNFGDNAKQYCPWLLNLTPYAELKELRLPHRYPRYQTYEISKPTIIAGYDPNDRNLIRCPIDQAEEIGNLYPEATLEYIATEHSNNFVLDRLDGIGETDYETVWKEFAATQNYDAKTKKVGLTYIRKAK